MRRGRINLNGDSHKTRKLLVILVVLSVFCLSIGYSAFTASNRIENIMATVRPRASARVTGFVVSNTANGGISNSEDYNKDNVFGTVNLPSANSTVTYKVDVTVFLGSEMMITNITGLNSNLEYSLSGYNLNDILCNSNNECNYGATAEFYITIGYKAGEYDSSSTTFPFNMNFTFESNSSIAKIGNNYYETLQDAIDAVPTTNTETTIVLLNDTAENVIVASGQNIVLDLDNHALSNKISDAVITSDGRVEVTNGTINCSAETAAINNNATGVFIINDGTISATGSKQAIYNFGSVEIGGTAYLKNTSSNRPSVHNLANATMIITGGTIESTRYRGVENHGTLTVGTKDGNPVDTPIIMGKTHGIFSDTGFNYYDGIIKGVTNAFNDETYITDTESTLSLMRKTETTSGSVYKVVQIGIPVTIIFNANGGNCSEASRTINSGSAIGTLPAITRTDYIFDGWFDALTGGNPVTASTIFTSDTEIFAHFHQTAIAVIGNTEYPSIQSAVNATKNQGHQTITLVNDSTINAVINVPYNCDITIDFDGHTVDSSVINAPMFEVVNGKLELINGTVSTATGATQGALNNRTANGVLKINNMTVNANGTRQAVYTEYGHTYIMGNSHLKNISSERAAVQNTKSGSTYITGGVIEAANFSAVFSDSGTLTIGDKDGNISASAPTIRGADYGVKCTATLNIYDGLFKGATGAISGTISDTESGSTQVTGTETIDGVTYQTMYLS